jgi:hypothetical protein
MSLKQNATTIAAVIGISHSNGVAGGCAGDDYDNHMHIVTSTSTQFCALICIR